MGAISGAGTPYPSGPPEFTPGFKGVSCYSIFCFMCMFLRSLLAMFLLAIVLCVLRFMDSFVLPLSSNSSSYTCKQWKAEGKWDRVIRHHLHKNNNLLVLIISII